MKDSSGRRVARARYADCKVLLRNAAVLLGFELAQLGDKPREKVASAFCESKQGAAQALEDGATLTACLKKYSDVVEALRRYEALLLQRATHIQGMATANKTRFHLPDGPAQRERDAKMAEGSTDWSIKAIAWIYGYDSAAAVDTGDLGLPPWAN